MESLSGSTSGQFRHYNILLCEHRNGDPYFLKITITFNDRRYNIKINKIQNPVRVVIEVLVHTFVLKSGFKLGSAALKVLKSF